MIVRTYTAELAGPAVESGGVVVTPLRRLRAWVAGVGTPWGFFTFRRGTAAPAAVQIRRGRNRPGRFPVRNPEGSLFGVLKMVSSAGSAAAKGKRR